jgi:hypothetical protein
MLADLGSRAARKDTVRRGAIVGFGFIAEKGHLPASLARRDAYIHAVADVCAARRELARGTSGSALCSITSAPPSTGASTSARRRATPSCACA